MNGDSLQHLYVIHRSMGCADESSTDEEQAEKILYFYPYDETTSSQLNKINMLEGLIEFAGKFSTDPLDTVVMERHTWGFLECEKDVWIIAAVDSNSIDDTAERAVGELHAHRPNAFGLQAALQRMYGMYHSFHGRLVDSIGGADGSGWRGIERVQLARKQMRKLDLRLRQERQDLETLRHRQEEGGGGAEGEEEGVGIRSSAATAQQVTEAVARSEAELAVRRAELVGLLAEDSVYRPRAVRDSLGRFLRLYLQTSGTLLDAAPSAFDSLHGVSPLLLGAAPGGNSALVRVRHAVEQQQEPCREFQCIGSVLSLEGQMLWSDLPTAASQAVAGFAGLLDLDALRRRAAALVEFCGGERAKSNSDKFRVTDAELEGFVAKRMADAVDGRRGFLCAGWDPLDLAETAAVNALLHWGSSTSDTDVDGNSDRRTALSDTDVLSDQCEQPSGLFCPRLFLEGACLGRLLFYRQNRFLLTLLLPDWSAAPWPADDSAVRAFLSSPAQPNDRTFGDKRLQVRVGPFLQHMAQPAGTRGEDGSAATLSNRFVTRRALDSTRLLAFCAALQQGVAGDLARLEGAAKAAAAGASSSVFSFSGGAHTAASGLVPTATAAAPTGLSSSSGSASPVLGGAAGPTASLKAAGREAKVVYHNSVSGSVKVSGVCREDLCPLVGLPRGAREALLTLLRERDPYRRRVIELVSERLGAESGGRFPFSCAALAASLEPAVMRALNDVWVELAGRELVDGRPSCVVEACLRVSTAQRGGVWVTGRRLSAGRYLYVVVDKCATLNDMYEVFEEVCDAAAAHSSALM